MNAPAPLDARRLAFADALGHLMADLVWREVCEETPKTPRPARPANLSGAVVEVENVEKQPHAQT